MSKLYVALSISVVYLQVLGWGGGARFDEGLWFTGVALRYVAWSRLFSTLDYPAFVWWM